jgi:hypothetical protein
MSTRDSLEQAASNTEARRAAPCDAFLVDAPEARRLLGGIAEGLLRARTKSGEIPCVRIGRRVFYRPADLDLYTCRLALGAASADTQTPGADPPASKETHP